ncbi:MAG: LuxR C-terminal-related transcriptional regulator [Bacteroidota bacterium]
MQKTVEIHTSIKVQERDIVIIQSLADGFKPKEIGENLKLSPRTVEQRLAVMKAQLNLKSTIQLVIFFIRNNLIK